MTRRIYTPERIINKWRGSEIPLSQGSTAGKATRNIGVTEQTHYRWRREYGGIRIDEVKRFKGLEKDNTRLKKLAADLSLDNATVKEPSRANF